jgi:hypothetical protein
MPAKVYCVEDKHTDNREAAEEDPGLFTAARLLLAVWVCVGLVPLLLQARSFAKFVTPHKINQLLVASTGTAAETADIDDHCPVEGLMVAGVWWNIGPRTTSLFHKADSVTLWCLSTTSMGHTSWALIEPPHHPRLQQTAPKATLSNTTFTTAVLDTTAFMKKHRARIAPRTRRPMWRWTDSGRTIAMVQR